MTQSQARCPGFASSRSRALSPRAVRTDALPTRRRGDPDRPDRRCLRLQSLARHRQGREHLLDRTQQRQTVTVSGHARRTRPRTDTPTGHGAGTWRRNPGHQRRRPQVDEPRLPGQLRSDVITLEILGRATAVPESTTRSTPPWDFHRSPARRTTPELSITPCPPGTSHAALRRPVDHCRSAPT